MARRRLGVALTALPLIALSWPQDAEADEPAIAVTPDSTNEAQDAAVRTAPQVSARYGVGVTVELPAGLGRLCPPGPACILGAGAGVVVRGGFGYGDHLAMSLAYSVTKQDSSKLYRLGTLQQFRAEGRWTLASGKVFDPFGVVALGAAAYGGEGAFDTFGPLASIGAGSAIEVAPATYVNVSLNYRLMRTSEFVDEAGTTRSWALARVVGLDVSFEAKDLL